MKFKFLKTTLVGTMLSVSCLVNLANAGAIIDTVNDSFIDANTGIEWMDFGINNIYTYSDVVSQLGEGGIYQGWSLANKDQVYTMWANAFLGLGASYENPDHFSLGQLLINDGANIDGSVIEQVVLKMGYNVQGNIGTVDDVEQANGIFEGTDGLSDVYFWNRTENFGLSPHNDVAVLRDDSNKDFLADETLVNFSTMLVKTSSLPAKVPEPTSIVIIALGIMGLGIRHFRQQ